MIWEIWQYLNTPTALHYAKPMGFVKESIAMAARAKRCQTTWQPHYQACQDAILEIAELCEEKRKVLIFGAGSLQDIPLDALSELFDQVLLVDLVFLPDARNQAAAYTNVQLIEYDVTESLDDLYHGNHYVAIPKRWLNDFGVDLVVSLNLMTQLPLMPVKWLESHFQLDEVEADDIGQMLMAAHLHYLQQFSEHADSRDNPLICLISDRWVQRFDKNGQLIKEFDPWGDVLKPEAQKEWDWQIMPLGEASRHYSQVNRVGVSIL